MKLSNLTRGFSAGQTGENQELPTQNFCTLSAALVSCRFRTSVAGGYEQFHDHTCQAIGHSIGQEHPIVSNAKIVMVAQENDGARVPRQRTNSRLEIGSRTRQVEIQHPAERDCETDTGPHSYAEFHEAPRWETILPPFPCDYHRNLLVGPVGRLECAYVH